MLFNSLDFAWFFPLVTALYYLLRTVRSRTYFLLFASCFFYMWLIPQYIFILALTIVVDYFAGIFIEKTNDQKIKKYWLYLSLIITCLILFVFKYFNFFNQNFKVVATIFGFKHELKNLDIILPVGLSFHTFQSISYVIEVYRGKQKAERNFGIYSLYVMFYPQLVAGPIERPQNLLHQFHQKHTFEWENLRLGLKLMLFGLVKKILIADQLATYVNIVYDHPYSYHGLTLIIATIFFAFQIYCDFSGYSDVARGAAKVMGFDLMLNFNTPYFSKSVGEFWRRWHISLSTWFRDYVYLPLGGSKCSRWHWRINILITFVISGLWHGANWTFIIWGALNGLFIIFSSESSKISESSSTNYLRIVATFFLVSLTWVFFRSNDLASAVFILKNMFLWKDTTLNTLALMGTMAFIKSFALILILVLVEGLISQERLLQPWNKFHPAVSWTIYSYLFLSLWFFCSGAENQFIYFQF